MKKKTTTKKRVHLFFMLVLYIEFHDPISNGSWPFASATDRQMNWPKPICTPQLLRGIKNFGYATSVLQRTVKILKFRTPQKIGCNHPKIWTSWLYRWVMHPKDADGIANSVDPDQTARSSLIWVCTVCPGLSVRKLRNITVVSFRMSEWSRKKTEPRHKKTCLRGFRPGKTQTSLLSYRD